MDSFAVPTYKPARKPNLYEPCMPTLDRVEKPTDMTALRQTMVDCQIRTFDVTDHAVIGRFLAVPRERFLPPELAAVAYSDLALKLPPAEPQAEARRLLPPATLARLIQAAGVKPGDKVLDVAPGTGYSTALLTGLAKAVVALETNASAAAVIEANLLAEGLSATTSVAVGPLAAGVPAEAPFDVIFVQGAVETHLDRLFQQLAPGGRLLTIVRKTVAPAYGACHAVRFEHVAGRISSALLFDVPAVVLGEFRKETEFVF